MAGRICNTREGYLHENLGCHLLRSISVVAQVPAYDDVGIDALATLLRPRVKQLKYAEGGTFGVQFKAESVEAIRYNWDAKEGKVKDMGHLEWLNDLEIPFFIGVIDPEKASLALYTTQLLYECLLSDHRIEAVDLVFTREAAGAEDVDEDGLKKNVDVAGVVLEDVKVENITQPVVYLGPPILKFDIFTIRRKWFHKRAYDVMKAWLEIQTDNGLSRRLGYMDKVQWKTCAIPKRRGLKHSINPLGPDVCTDVLKALRTPIRCLAYELLAKGEGSEEAPVEDVMKVMRKYGLDPDAEGLIDQVRKVLLPFRGTNKLAREKAAAKAAANQGVQDGETASGTSGKVAT